MNIQAISSEDVQRFIHDHEFSDERVIALQKHDVFGLSPGIIAGQIAARRKAREKIAVFYHTSGIIYPPALNLEQSSSEITARYKAGIISSRIVHHDEGVDLTGGFGVDAFYLSDVVNRMNYVEQDASLTEIVRHNFILLKTRNIEIHQCAATEFLKTLNHPVDFIYIDPSRRKAGNQKVYSLADSEPDVIRLQNEVFAKANLLVVKGSPLFDIHVGLQELKNIKEVFVVSVDNDCKELLFLCERDYSGDPKIHAVNIQKDQVNSFSFSLPEERAAQSQFTMPMKFLYEPNAAVLKAGAFRLIAHRFGLQKLHVSTHLYTSNNYVENFPGRIFHVEEIIKPEVAVVKERFPDGKANVITRNYPLTSEELKKKLKLKDGGEKYLVAGTALNQKVVCVAKRLK